MSRKRLHRVFLDRRLDRGGRFWGAWYQSVPKRFRQKILIDEAPTLELDFSALHPNLLYALVGADRPEGDLYRLDGYSDETRKFLKAFFLRIINAKSREGAKGSIREAAFGKRKVKIPKELGKLENKYLDPLIDRFAEKHKPINHFFFSGYGNTLQYIDSQITEHILHYYAGRGVAVLPLHDSYRIDARLFDELRNLMHTIIYQNFGRHIPISNDDLQPLVESMGIKMIKDLEDGTGDTDEIEAIFEDLEVFIERYEGLMEKAKNQQGG